jgi:hypothetical protein
MPPPPKEAIIHQSTSVTTLPTLNSKLKTLGAQECYVLATRPELLAKRFVNHGRLLIAEAALL